MTTKTGITQNFTISIAKHSVEAAKNKSSSQKYFISSFGLIYA